MALRKSDYFSERQKGVGILFTFEFGLGRLRKMWMAGKEDRGYFR